VLIATGGELAARRAAAAAGLEPRIVLAKRRCAGGLRSVRLDARRLRARVVAIHSADWSREPLPQLLELAALRVGAHECVLLDADGGAVTIGRGRLAARLAAAPLEGAVAVAMVGREVGALALESRRRPAPRVGTNATQPALLAIWPGGAHVGGSVTHMSGVLAGFRALGFRIGLVALAPPAEQITTLVDDLEVAPPLARPARLTAETNAICSSRAAVDAGLRLLARFRPTLVYQRHEAFLTCGIVLARRAHAPFVLEWNNSEAWARRHWHLVHPAKRAFNPLAAAMERLTLSRADLVAAVSRQAAAMALAGGADHSRVAVIPNAVDFAAVDRALAAGAREPDRQAGAGRAYKPRKREPERATVGWVGSFFPWHGADMLVRALALLPARVGAVMVGDGPQRAACQALADELGVAARVEWPGQLSHAEALRRLADCDVLTSPHVPIPEHPFFGSPTKIFEYMALGVPIVASALEQIAEILEHGRTALLVRPADPHQLAAAIQRVLALPDHGRALGRHAREEARRAHTWEARASALLQALVPAEGGSGAIAPPSLALAARADPPDGWTRPLNSE
jgi:glycosyltransferase involved in cell wall biosynthesis